MLNRRVHARVAAIHEAAKRDRVIGGQSGAPHSQNSLIWQKPPHPFVKLNCDATVMGSGTVARCGGLISDEFGSVLWAFTRKLDPCSILEAELRSIFYGVQIAKEKGVRYLIVESDCETTVNLLVEGASSVHELRELIVNIRNLLPALSTVIWRHVYREVNGAAGGVAKSCLKSARVSEFFVGNAPVSAGFIISDEAGRVVAR